MRKILNRFFYKIRKRRPLQYECPICKYRIMEKLILMSKYDYPCPRCERAGLYSFKLVYWR
jgi:hypothetical protein